MAVCSCVYLIMCDSVPAHAYFLWTFDYIVMHCCTDETNGKQINGLRQECHYGKNDSDSNGDVHGMKHHRKQSVTP